MPRYFYDDPLAAAWMAKHFGMRFTGIIPPPPVTYSFKHDDVSPLFQRIYIHPDSLALLEPQLHDLVDFGWIHPCGQSFHEISLMHTTFDAFCDESTCDYDSHRIIQRNGLAFMWPKEEV